MSDSRCAHFDAVMDATGGEGVDIVLNSLAGKQMLRSLQLLRPFGRFIEIGKRDQYDHTPVDLHPFLEGLTYATAHLDVLMLRRPAQARALMLEVWKEVELGHLAPLPSKVFPIGQLRDSLQYFSQGVHIGKILIEMDVPEVTVQQPKSARSGAFGPLPEPDDGWCIVAGVGPAAAAWLDRLAAGGARNLLCIGAAAGALADCRAHTVSPADLVAHGPAFWSRARPPIDATARLQGIVHVAADAAPSPESCRDALALAQALHALAAAAPPLEFFVTVAPADGGVLPGPVGAAPPRPTAWPAAAFGARLRQLDRARRARGVPSVCVQVHAGGGGVVDLSPAEIVQECAAAWPQVAAADAAALEDGLLLSKRGPKELAAALGPCYAAPFEAADGDGEAQGVSSAVIREWLAAYVAAEFGLAAADVDLHRRLEDYGFDSLALINLSRRLVKVVGSEVTALDMYDHPSIAALAERFGAPATAPAASPAAPPSSSGPVPVTPAPAPSTVSGLVTAGRRRVLCLHGFRTNRDIMKLQCRGLVQHFEADVEFAFLDAPHPASGPGEPEIERQGLPVREWYPAVRRGSWVGVEGAPHGAQGAGAGPPVRPAAYSGLEAPSRQDSRSWRGRREADRGGGGGFSELGPHAGVCDPHLPFFERIIPLWGQRWSIWASRTWHRGEAGGGRLGQHAEGRSNWASRTRKRKRGKTEWTTWTWRRVGSKNRRTTPQQQVQPLKNRTPCSKLPSRGMKREFFRAFSSAEGSPHLFFDERWLRDF